MDKRERFKKEACISVNMLIRRINSLTKFSNTKFYEYSSNDVTRMFKAMRKELLKSHKVFDKAIENKKLPRNTFKFNSHGKE